MIDPTSSPFPLSGCLGDGTESSNLLIFWLVLWTTSLYAWVESKITSLTTKDTFPVFSLRKSQGFSELCVRNLDKDQICTSYRNHNITVGNWQVQPSSMVATGLQDTPNHSSTGCSTVVPACYPAASLQFPDLLLSLSQKTDQTHCTCSAGRQAAPVSF